MNDDPRGTSSRSVFAILGAAGGIGSALARRLAGDGALVLLGGRRRQALETLASEIGGAVEVVDASDFEAVAEVIAWLLSEHSGWVSGQVWGVDGGLSALKTLTV